MKRTIALLLTLFCLLTAVSCGGRPSGTGSTTAGPDNTSSEGSPEATPPEATSPESDVTTAPTPDGTDEDPAGSTEDLPTLPPETVDPSDPPEPQDGLEYTLSADGTSYTVTGCTDRNATEITVPATHKGLPVTAIGNDAFEQHPAVRIVILPVGITSLGAGAFRHCPNLVEVRLPEGLLTVEHNAFTGCLRLTTVNLPESLTSLGTNAFGQCTSLVEIVLPAGLSTVEQHTFRGCTALVRVVLPVGITRLSSMAFYECTSLVEIVLPEGLLQIDSSVFENCTSLLTVSLPKSVTHVGTSAFFGCTSLKNLFVQSENLPAGLGSAVGSGTKVETSHTHTFVDHPAKPSTCTEQGWNAYQVCSTCQHSTIVYLPKKPHTEVVDAGVKATCTEGGFTDGKHCSACGSILAEKRPIPAAGHSETVDAAVPPTCTADGKTAGKHCSVCGTVTVAQTAVTALGHAFEWITDREPTESAAGLKHEECFCGAKQNENTAIPQLGGAYSVGLTYALDSNGTAYRVTGIGTCTDTHIRIPETHEGLPVKGLYTGCFRDCTQITAVTIPKTVDSISYEVFSGCSSLTTLTVDPANTTFSSEGNCVLKKMQTAGEYKVVVGCGGSVIPADKGIVFIDLYAFYRSPNLESVTVPEGVRIIDYAAFAECPALKSVTLPSTLVTVGASAFYRCTSFTSFELPRNLTSYGQGILSECSSLTELIIHTPEITDMSSGSYRAIGFLFGTRKFEGSVEVTQTVLPSGGGTFFWPASLTKLTVLSGTLRDEYLSNSRSSAPPITTLILGKGVTELKDRVITSTVTDIYYEGTTAEWNALKKGEYWDVKTDGTYRVHCSDTAETPKESTGLRFTEAPDGSGYYAAGIGSCADNAVVIPATHEGRPVTGIATNAFMSCGQLTSVVIPSGVTYIGDHAFDGCSSLESITMPPSLTYLGGYAFGRCSSLGSITVPAGITKIAGYTFSYCTSLTEIVIPSGVTQIDSYAFVNCKALASVTVPASVLTIHEFAFASLPVTQFYYLGTEAGWNAIRFGNNWNYNMSGWQVHYA